MTIHERIKRIRNENSLTMDVFGKRIGIGKTAISHIESGRANPSDQTIRSICREFGIEEAWLRTGEGEPYQKPDTFNLDEFARERGASDMELAFVKAYFTMSDTTRKEIMENLSTMFDASNKSADTE